MRTLGVLALVVAAALGADADREVARARAHLKRGQEQNAKAQAARSNARRLQALERAEFFLGRADGAAAKAADTALRGEIRAALVDTIVRTAAVHYQRKSLPRARTTVSRALKLDPRNPRARALLAAIKKAEDTDIFESVNGLVGIDRVQARRLAAGVPLRDRGLGRRR